METALQIILGIIALICFLGGVNLLTKGAQYFLPKEMPPQIILDNAFRFLSGIYLSMGFLCSWAVMKIAEINDLVYLLGVTVLFSGLGRLYSRIKIGKGSAYLTFAMLLEFVLAASLILLQYFR